MTRENMKILITGGAGFIGSNLCEYFIAKNHSVVCLDNLSTGFYDNIVHLIEHPNFTFIQGDIRDLEECKRAVAGCDYVLHEAALGSVPRSINDPITTNDVNIGGFLNMLVASRDEKVKRFVFAASSSTYGDSKNLPKVEDVIGKPLSPYAITKYVNELYAEIFAKTYNLEYIGLRYFNVFGKRQTPNGAYAAVIPKFISQLIEGESPVINGDGSFSRDFTYIKNVIHMNEQAILTENKDAINQVYNTAFGETTTLNELIEILKKELSSFNSKIKEVKVVYGSERAGDIPHSLASVDKAKQLLVYKPEYSIKDGLKESIEWYWEFLNKENK
jgi:UDP-N-acetylglucosamine 4-epimerase